jgi:uncharacterized membrane protein required for colicin V production
MPNWVDVFILCVIARGIYIGLHSNLFAELFKALGVFFATFVTLHYYSFLSGYIKDYFRKFDIFPDFLAFILIALLITVVFYVMKEGWQFILKIAFPKKIELWGGFIFSLLKTYLLCGLIILSFLVSGNPTLSKSARASVSNQFLHTTSLDIYESLFKGFVQNWLPNEKINETLMNQMKQPPKNQ